MPARVPTTNPAGAFPEDSFKYSPLEHVRSLFVGFFQGLFSAAPVGAYHWEEDVGASEVYISTENPIKAEVIGQRPAISVTRAPVQFYSLGLDDMLTYDFQTGTKRKSVLVPGTMIVNCSSREPLETERIAWICAENLWLHRELLMAAGFFEIGRQPAIGSPTPAGSIVAADAGDEWYVTPVTCPYQFYRTSQTSPLNKKILREVQLNIRAALQCVSTQTPSLGGVGIANGSRCGPVATDGANVAAQVQGAPPPPFAPLASDVYGNTPNPGAGPPVLPTVPHPLNPAQMVTIRAARPNCPAVRPPSMGGRTIPISVTTVEESCGNQEELHVTAASTVKV